MLPYLLRQCFNNVLIKYLTKLFVKEVLSNGADGNALLHFFKRYSPIKGMTL